MGGDSQQFVVITRFWMGMSHNPSLEFLYPFKIILLFFEISMFCLFMRMLHPSSQSRSREIKLALVSLGNIRAFLAVLERCGERGKIPCSVEVIIVLLEDRLASVSQ